MSELRDQIRRAREAWHEVGRFGFLVRRPTAEQVRLWREDPWSTVLARCVLDWRGVKGSDLVDGGPDAPAAWDADDFAEWISDRADVLNALSDLIVALVAARAKVVGATEKN